MTPFVPISLIGAPTDIGAGDRGASMGPEALRVAGIAEALQSRGLDVADRGNLFGPLNPWLPPSAGYRHLNQVIEWNREVMRAVGNELEARRLPILLGGDHSLAIGSISAVANHCRDTGKQLRILWLDAHADFNTSQITPSGNLHGMPVSCLCGFGPSRTGRTRRSRARDRRGRGSARSASARSTPAKRNLVRDSGIDIYDMRYIDEVGMRRAMEEALEGVDEKTHLHVSFDVDFLDPDIAPGVGTTIPGGPNYREAQLVMEMIADTGRIGSLDIVELNPALDSKNATAKLAVDLVESLFGKSTLMRE